MKESASDGEKTAGLADTGNGPRSEWADLREWQRADPELGPIIRFRLESDDRPSWSDMSPKAEHTKRLWNQWSRLEVHNGHVYRRYTGNGHGGDYRQLLVPRRCVENVLFNTHGRRTLRAVEDAVPRKRRFYWGTWKTDVIRYCRQCPQCCQYHRGKLPRQAPLQPVIAGAPMERLCGCDRAAPNLGPRQSVYCNIYGWVQQMGRSLLGETP